MRIVAGKFGGRTLVTPKDNRVRPTSDRVRESVFNILANQPDWKGFEGARVIDLFAGTGALGLEAMSRGASYCLFVEQDARARALIRQNIEAFDLQGITRIFRRDACSLGPRGTFQPFDLAFLDPPYGKGLGERAVQTLLKDDWLAERALVVVEERAGVEVVLPDALEAVTERVYGDTQVVVERNMNES